MGSHEEFRELCALSTSDDLTEEEKTTLREHLTVCSECRETLKQYQTTADIGVPLFAAEGAGDPSSKTESWSVDAASASFLMRMDREGTRPSLEVASGRAVDANELASRNGRPTLSEHWNTVWLPFAAAILLAATLGIYAYRAGIRRGSENTPAPQVAIENPHFALQRRISDVSHDREVALAHMSERDKLIAGLRRQADEKSRQITVLKNEEAVLQRTSKASDEANQELAAKETATTQRLDAAQATLQKTQKELETLQTMRSRDGTGSQALQARIEELTQLLRDRDSTIDQQQELLADDRDIRELMGARDLYVAEVLDIAKNGTTQKSYGRIFFTKGKSLIFYAYDLDRQPGLKDASTFQAWGQCGTDRAQALNLGIFFEDNVSKKRWILKFDDSQKLAQIDAVFVTVEPNGGSHKPSSKPFLFAYLKVNPNHP